MILEYLQVKSAYQSKAVPNRDEITFLTKITGIPQLWMWKEESPVPQQVTFLPDRVVDAWHSPSGQMTIVGMDCKGDERQQLYLLQEKGKEATLLTDSPAHFHYFGGWSPCETKIAWSSNRRHPGSFDVFVQSLLSTEVETVYHNDGRCDPVCWHPDGDKLILSVQKTNLDNSLLLLDLATGRAEKLAACARAGSFSSLVLTKDGLGGYVVTDRDTNTKALCRFTFANDQLERIAHVAQWDIDEAKLSQDEKRIAYTVNEGGISALFLHDLNTGASLRAEDLPKGVISSLSWLNDEQVIFTLKSPTLPGDIWRYNISTQKAERLTQIGRAEQIESTWIEPQLHTFTSFDGLTVPYFMYAKNPSAKSPVVVYVHGGPESQIRAEYHPVFQYLANQGFIVVAPNVRGSTGYGREYVRLDDGRKRLDAVADLAWLVKDLSRMETVDPAAIGIMGRSYGGFMVLAALTQYPDLWAAGVDIVGISHFRTFLENTGAWRRKLREAEYGTLQDDSDFFEEIAPLNLSHRIKAPLLVFHGRNDTRVPVSEAQQLVSDMKQRGQEVELIIFEDEGHFTEKLENHIALNTKIARFFSERLAAAGR